jgi:hypothetical protein
MDDVSNILRLQGIETFIHIWCPVGISFKRPHWIQFVPFQDELHQLLFQKGLGPYASLDLTHRHVLWHNRRFHLDTLLLQEPILIICPDFLSIIWGMALETYKSPFTLMSIMHPNHLDHHFEWGLNRALPALLMRMSIWKKLLAKN